jgi:hypothetical protein
MQSHGLWSADGDIYRRRYFNCVDPEFISALNRVVYSQSVLLHDACLEQARVVKAGKLRCVLFALNCFCPQLFLPSAFLLFALECLPSTNTGKLSFNVLMWHVLHSTHTLRPGAFSGGRQCGSGFFCCGSRFSVAPFDNVVAPRCMAVVLAVAALRFPTILK